VKFLRPIALFAAAIGVAAVVTLGPGCEEVLEVCAPCGSLAQGNVSISGEPRIDGTLEASYHLWTIASGAIEQLDNQLAQLATEYGTPLPADGQFRVADVQTLIDAIRAQLDDPSELSTVFEVEPGSCWTDTELALARQLSCEDRTNCYIPQECEEEQLGSCTGLCVGQCLAGCEGTCFAQASASNEECLGECIGACDADEQMSCAGRCAGDCSSSCSAYDAHAICDGFCPGLCMGNCLSAVPFDCVGLCRGMCQVPRGEEDACDGTCRGECSESVCEGQCRGHFRPEGCDLPDRCESLHDCQETAKALGWSYTRCTGAAARVGVVFSPTFEGDRAVVIGMAERLEQQLSLAAQSHALLALLTDGVDDTGEIEPADLEEAAGATTVLPAYIDQPELLAELSVVADRVHLPLSGLKARLGMLARDATSGDYQIAAGPLPCVQPAFEEAHSLIDSLIPTTGGAEPAIDRSTGLYRAVDAQRKLLELAWPTP
jgi:hypothetical protein